MTVTLGPQGWQTVGYPRPVPGPRSIPLAEAGLVAVGGAAGSLARWGVAEVVPGPAGTLVVNLSGSLLIGLLAGWLFATHPRLRLLLGVGVLGGYTTFSTHLLDAHALLPDPGAAAAYVGGTLVGCVVAAVVGLHAGRAIGPAR